MNMRSRTEDTTLHLIFREWLNCPEYYQAEAERKIQSDGVIRTDCLNDQKALVEQMKKKSWGHQAFF